MVSVICPARPISFRLDLGAHRPCSSSAPKFALAPLMLWTARTKVLLLTGGARGVHVGETAQGARVREEEFDHFLEEPVVALALEALEGFEAVPVQHRGFRRGRGAVVVGLDGWPRRRRRRATRSIVLVRFSIGWL